MAKAPSILGVSVIFGGIAGMTTAALLDLDTGGGFVVGFLTLFAILFIASAFSTPIGFRDATVEELRDEKHKLEQLRAENRSLKEQVRKLEGLGEGFGRGGKVRGA